MIKKSIQKIIYFVYWQWCRHFVICPYSLNEPKYMEKGLKPFSRVGETKQWNDAYEYPRFKKLLDNGTILEYKTSQKTINRFGEKIELITLYFYYPNEEWRVHRMIKIWNNLDNYKNSIEIREGLLFGYPKKYIRRSMLSNKINKWLKNKGLIA